MNDITNIEDIRILVYAFYKKVLKDDLLAPIFNNIVEESQWPGHLEIMARFWETNIFHKQSYNGNPMSAHIKVDAKVNHSINQNHFDRWLNLWNQTIDENFQGENSDNMKKRAVDMGKLILFKIKKNQADFDIHN